MDISFSTIELIVLEIKRLGITRVAGIRVTECANGEFVAHLIHECYTSVIPDYQGEGRVDGFWAISDLCIKLGDAVAKE